MPAAKQERTQLSLMSKTTSLKLSSYMGEIIFVALAGFCLYTYTALFSFHPFDTSIQSASFPMRKPFNLGGEWGAHLSAISIYYLGIMSFFAPIFAMTLLVFALKTMSLTTRIQKNLGLLGLFVALCILIGKVVPLAYFASVGYASGGRFGSSVGAFLNQRLGVAGSIIAVTTLLITSILFLLQRSFLQKTYAAVNNYFKELFSTKSDIDQKQEKTDIIPSEADKLSSEPTLFKVAQQNSPVMHRGETLGDAYLEDAEEDAEIEVSDDDSEEEDEDAPSLKDESYEPPPLTIFRMSDSLGPLTATQKKEFELTAKTLTTTFEDFGIKGSVVAIQPGPVVTVFEFQPDAGTKLAKINSLVDDLALSLRVDSIIMHPVRGKRAVGIQVPNTEREMVRLGDILQSKEFQDPLSPLTLALGKSIAGEPVCADLTKMPHLLTAGATGSGKSVAINALLCSVIMKASPRQVRMLLVDPKMLELSMYEGVPHLLMPVITEPEKAAVALKWATQEMERRYKLMQHAKVRNILGFNEFCRVAGKASIDEVKSMTGEDRIEELPYILIVIDELADLMMTAPKEVESLIQRLAQKARASGIHLVLATQRPSVDIITGVIKANLPCRAAFQVVSKHDSRTILDQIGADKLLGNGDMLFQRPGSNRLERIQGAFITDEEVINFVNAVKQKARIDYDEDVMRWIEEEAQRNNDGKFKLGDSEPMDDDPKWDEAIHIAQGQGAISASFLQRQLKIGYNRAARIVETMESQGLVAKADGVKPRKWLGPSV